jgi:AmiR/NasT family two-component response regulator
MSDRSFTPNFEGRRALVLHRPHELVEALSRQLGQLGVATVTAWPELGAEAVDADFLFFDADMGFDGQFPWPEGTTPMPAIALIGSEAPGRLAWAIRQGADAHLLKPVGSGGVFSALVIAREAFARRSAMRAELDGLRGRLDKRQLVAEATACLMVQNDLGTTAAYELLRRRAMEAQLTIEAMAERITDALRTKHVRDRA